ncbi:MAG: hypothetical protein EZS28_055720, partial [Streblomastix strix]
ISIDAGSLSLGGDSIPAPRYYHTAVEYKNKMYIFGGKGEVQVYNDLWEFDPKDLQWRKLVTQGNVPSPRMCHISVVIGDELFIQGGTYQIQNQLGDMHCINLRVFNQRTNQLIERNFNDGSHRSQYVSAAYASMNG